MELLHALHRAHQFGTEKFMEEVGSVDVTPRQAVVLQAAKESPKLSQTGLVNATGIDRSTLADIVKRLQKRGLMQRRRTREDARAYAVQITPEGEKLLAIASRAAKSSEQALLKKFPTLKTLNGS